MTMSDGVRSGPAAAVGWFRVIAVAEAFSWVGLLAGMYFKYVGDPRTEIGVKVFGPIHGLIFIAFVVAGLLVGVAHRWRVNAWLAALLGSVVPLGSVIFLWWADRTGRMSSSESASASTVQSAASGPPADHGA